jgi:hypothetical protein
VPNGDDVADAEEDVDLPELDPVVPVVVARRLVDDQVPSAAALANPRL